MTDGFSQESELFQNFQVGAFIEAGQKSLKEIPRGDPSRYNFSRTISAIAKYFSGLKKPSNLYSGRKYSQINSIGDLADACDQAVCQIPDIGIGSIPVINQILGALINNSGNDEK